MPLSARQAYHVELEHRVVESLNHGLRGMASPYHLFVEFARHKAPPKNEAGGAGAQQEPKTSALRPGVRERLLKFDALYLCHRYNTASSADIKSNLKVSSKVTQPGREPSVPAVVGSIRVRVVSGMGWAAPHRGL